MAKLKLVDLLFSRHKLVVCGPHWHPAILLLIIYLFSFAFSFDISELNLLFFLASLSFFPVGNIIDFQYI